MNANEILSVKNGEKPLDNLVKDGGFASIFRTIAVVGDSLSADMQGGKNAGITTIWFNRDDMPDEEDVRPDYEIRSLYELPPLMKRI